jgi:hypothetical protein
MRLVEQALYWFVAVVAGLLAVIVVLALLFYGVRMAWDSDITVDEAVKWLGEQYNPVVWYGIVKTFNAMVSVGLLGLAAVAAYYALSVARSLVIQVTKATFASLAATLIVLLLTPLAPVALQSRLTDLMVDMFKITVQATPPSAVYSLFGLFD